MLNLLRSILASSVVIALAGCGGGGSSSSPTGPVVSTLSFPMLSGFQTLTASGWSKTFAISGTCSGSLSMARAPANVAVTFEGQSALSATESITMTFSNCTPASSATTATLYYNSSNYYPLGLNSVGVNYGVYLIAPVIPATVTVGSTAVLGSETLYTDSTKAVPNGRIDESFVVEADTATTAIVNLIAKEYNAMGALIFTEQDRYRMSSTGALTPISWDVQYTNGNHLVGK
jgi:hypothetical protein